MDYMPIIFAYALAFSDTSLGENANTHSKIIIDISQLIQNGNHHPGNNNTTRLNEALRTILEKGQENNFGTPSVLFYESEFSEGIVQQIQYLLDILQVHSNTKILFSIKVPAVTKFNNSSNDQLTITRLINVLAKHSTTVAGITIETIAGGNPSSHISTTITVENIKSSLSKLNAITNLKLGYMLDWLNVNSFTTDNNIRYADYLIVNIPLQKNDDIFVESFVAFKDKIKSVLNSTETQIKKLNLPVASGKLYFKIGIKATLTISSPAKRFSNGKLHNASEVDRKALDELNIQLEELNSLYGRKYDDLLTQYCYEWLANDRSGRNIIVSDNTYNNSQLPASDKAMVIPNVSNIFLKRNMPDKSQLKNYLGYVLEDIRSSGFNKIMINGDLWQTLSESKSEYILPCSKPKCRPEHVMYYNNQDYAFSMHNKSEIQELVEVGDMRLSTIIFSPKYRESNTTSWQEVFLKINKISSTLVKGEWEVNVQRACVEVSDLFSRIDISSECDNTCASLGIKQLIGCNSIGIFSPIIFWQGVLRIQHYSITNFVTNIMKRLDTLLIARQLIRIRYSNDDLQVVLSIRMEHNTTAVDGTKFSLYCHPKDAIVYQFYEMLITWAKIHEFPIIIDPTPNEDGFINPISWNPLTTSSSMIIKKLMTSSPLFIRRSYSLSSVFRPEWTKGMYPCLHQAISKENLNTLNFNHDFTGVTINMDLRTNNVSLTSNELKTMLLYSLGKFNTIEIILLTENHIQTLLDVLSEAHFDMILKQNSIQNKNMYLQVFSLQHEPAHVVILKLQQFGLQVHISILTAQDLVLFTGNSNLTLGFVQESCTSLAKTVISDRDDISLQIFSTNISFLICNTVSIPARNSDKKSMQEYLEAHLYMRKLFQYIYPNLKEVHFRLHPLTYKTTNISEVDKLNEMLFLADVNNFAQGHEVHYFLLPILPRENTSDFQESSFWTVNNYEDLSDLSIYQEKLAAVLNVTAWTPMPTWASPTTSTSTNSSVNMGSGELLEPDTSKLIIYIVAGLSSVLIIIVLLLTFIRRRYDVKISCTNYFRLWLENYRNRRKISGTSLRLYRQSPDVNSPSTLNQYNTQSEIEVDNKLESGMSLSEIPQKNASGLVTSSFHQKINKEHEQSDMKTHQDSTLETDIQTIHEIPKDRIHIMFNKILGSGQFGIVYRAKMNGYPTDVAVKMVHDDSPRESLKGMWSEIKLLCGIGNHSNVVKFIGCYTIEIQNGILWIVTELCSHGSLLSFLRDVEAERVSEKLTLRKLNKFSLEIAKGMDYIGARNIIHGDLSTRNVLLDEHFTCKIGDFGLSRKMYTYEMYIKTSHEPLPWRWMAYESLKKLEFSVQSDVWGYGVTLWEIFTLGDVPYPGLSWSVEFVNELRNGLRLASSTYGNDEINAVMQQCWKIKPKERPSFSELTVVFEGQLQKKDIDDIIVQ